MQELIEESVEAMGEKVTVEEKEKQKTALTKMLVEGVAAKDALNISDDCLEFMYSNAVKMYDSGKYHDAELIFLFLVMLYPGSFRYQMGKAAALHMQKKYNEAIGTYALCVPLAPANPTPYYHAADCFLKLRDLPRAYIHFQLAIGIAGLDPKFAKIAERCKLNMQHIAEELNKEKERKTGE